MLTTGVMLLMHKPCGHWVSLWAWERSFQPCVPASLIGDHGDGSDFCGNTWSDKMGCRGFGIAYCASVPFSALLLLRRKQKTAAQSKLSVPLFFNLRSRSRYTITRPLVCCYGSRLCTVRFVTSSHMPSEQVLHTYSRSFPQ